MEDDELVRPAYSQNMLKGLSIEKCRTIYWLWHDRLGSASRAQYVQNLVMHQSILSPLLPALVDEAYRVAFTLWGLPWYQEGFSRLRGTIELINDW